METRVIKNESELTMQLSGRLDTNAAPQVSAELEELLVDGVKCLILDMEGCDYVSSSGLRTILGAQKKMNSMQGTMVVRNAAGAVMEVFDMTGFTDILTFE